MLSQHFHVREMHSLMHVLKRESCSTHELLNELLTCLKGLPQSQLTEAAVRSKSKSAHIGTDASRGWKPTDLLDLHTTKGVLHLSYHILYIFCIS